MENDEVRVAVLEQKQLAVEHFVEKLDSAIEKITEVNNKVSRMLAVHEEKISKQEQIDEILFTKIDELRDKMDSDHVEFVQDYRYWNGNFGLASEHWEQF